MRKLAGNRTHRVTFGIILVFLLMGFIQSHWRQTNIGWGSTASAAEDQPGLAATEPPSPVSTTAEGSRAGRPESGHTDPFSIILLEVAVIIAVAGVGRWVASKFEQPSVLGELLIGVVLGNIGYASSLAAKQSQSALARTLRKDCEEDDDKGVLNRHGRSVGQRFDVGTGRG